MHSFIRPDWPAPDCIGAAISTRETGVSKNAYACNNLALHVGDNASQVLANRQALSHALYLPQAPQWLEQVHSTNIIEANPDGLVRTADGATTEALGLACAVLTADCLPVLICDKKGQQVAAIHAGWRGLAKGILPVAVKKFTVQPAELLVYLGPAISSSSFEVGVDVLEAFFESAQSNEHRNAVGVAMQPSHRPLRFYADLYALARASLNAIGVQAIYGGDYCTYTEADRFYSYRRDGETGRMASLIWRMD